LVIGYFNVLHAGHVQHLKALAAMGDVFVAIYNDVKNAERFGVEAVTLTDRVECLRACKYVSDITIMGDGVSIASRVQADRFGGHETQDILADDLNLPGMILPVEPVSRIPKHKEAMRPAAWLAF